jgi:hypothetical protein
MLQIVWLREGKSEMDEWLVFICCIRLLIISLLERNGVAMI